MPIRPAARACALALCALILGCGRGGSPSSPTATGAKGIQIKGSDTIVNLVQAWAEEFATRNPAVNIGVTGGGSGTGFAALINGTCDIAMSSRPIEEKEREQAKKEGIAPAEIPVGLDGLAVIVHLSNPVGRLTVDQTRAIFMGSIENWKGLGGEDRPVVILSRESNSGTHVFFKEHVLRRGNKKGTEEFAPEALLMPSSQAIVNEVVQNPNAVGYVGMGYLSPELKAVSIAPDPRQAFVAPTVENVASLRYPISRPLYLYTNGPPSGLVGEFVAYALSNEGQAVVRKLDFVPVQ